MWFLSGPRWDNMDEIRIVGPGKTRGYPYPVCKKKNICLPLSTCTSKILWSSITFCPLQVLQRNLGLILSPFPRHSPHTDWICWTIPGPNCIILTYNESYISVWIYFKGKQLCHFPFMHFQWKSTLKGKNLLLLEQILSFESRSFLEGLV